MPAFPLPSAIPPTAPPGLEGLPPRVQGDLAHALAAVRAADPRLRALVLTGAFARGEGALVDGRPQNDYDLIALRGLGAPREPYPRVRRRLEQELGVHVDLAPVSAWRLWHVRPTIFWYETALAGRILWGEPDLLDRVPVRRADLVAPSEGLRLLVNRAAGLLLATGMPQPHDVRVQSAKALLAALDAQLLAAGAFPPSHRGRWDALLALRAGGRAKGPLAGDISWFAWALAFKTDPATADPRAADAAWKAARRALLDAVPVALRHAGLPSVDAYARRDGLVDHLIYHRRSGTVEGARRWAMNPTGRIRLATLRLLELSPDGQVPTAEAHRWLRGFVASPGDQPVLTLEALRMATLQ